MPDSMDDSRRMAPDGVVKYYGPFVLVDDCKGTSGKILENIQMINADLGKIKNSIYGIEKAGNIEGGLVNMMRGLCNDVTTIKNNGENAKKAKLTGRDKALIIVAVIGGTFGLASAVIQALC